MKITTKYLQSLIREAATRTQSVVPDDELQHVEFQRIKHRQEAYSNFIIDQIVDKVEELFKKYSRKP